MKILFVLGISLLIYLSGQSQPSPSDLLVLKKHERTIKSYFPGDEIFFNTASGNYYGYIKSIKNDSLFIVQYDIRQIQTSLGVYILDTITSYSFAVNYKEIISLGKNNQKHFDWSASGGALFGGGIILTTVGLGTWIFTKPNTQYYASPYLVGGGALLAGIGYLLLKSKSKGQLIGKKYSLEYIQVK